MVSERRGTDSISASQPTIEELRDALAARDELISVIGHELRNAMAPLVLLAAQFELMPSADDMMRKKVAMLQRNLDTFIGTLDRVGEVSQLRDNKLELEPERCDLDDVVREVCREQQALATAGRTELRIASTSCAGQWDRARVKQIVAHLVTNAIRHGGGGVVDIELHADGDRIELVVQDAGPGIPGPDREHLFDRFDRKGTRRTGGLGVGLWVTKSLCRAMGGSVRLAESARGARFCVSLPRG